MKVLKKMHTEPRHSLDVQADEVHECHLRVKGCYVLHLRLGSGRRGVSSPTNEMG